MINAVIEFQLGWACSNQNFTDIIDEKAKRERREKIQRNRERKVASGQINTTRVGSTLAQAASPPARCYRSNGSPTTQQHPPSMHPLGPGDTSEQHLHQQAPPFYPILSAPSPTTSVGGHHGAMSEDTGIGNSWQMVSLKFFLTICDSCLVPPSSDFLL